MGRKRLLQLGQVLEAIQRLLLESGQPPTIVELKKELGVGSTRTVLRYLAWLEEAGDIRRWSGARGMRLLRRPKGGIETIAVPLVGEAPAGPAMVAEENHEGSVRMPRDLLPSSSARCFLLRVRGDSMNRASVKGGRIEHGDLVLVRQVATARSGEVVVALIDGEATIKRISRGRGYSMLKPDSENPKHQAVVAGPDLRVQGVVVRVLKKGSELLGRLEE